MGARGYQDEREGQKEKGWRLWLMSFLVVLLAHGALAAGVLSSRAQEPEVIGQGEPMVIELAPVAASAASASAGTPDNPEPDPPEVDDPPPLEEPEAVQPEPEPEPETEALAQSESTSEQTEFEDTDRAWNDSENVQAQEPNQQSEAHIVSLRANWQSEVNAHLERHKRYPHGARSRREEGSARLRFKIDRRGRVLNVDLEQSSGSFLLDREVQSVVHRAQPLPKPPADVVGEVLELVWQVEFALRR